jgi:hypothetical protein
VVAAVAVAVVATAYLWRRGPAYRTSHGTPGRLLGHTPSYGRKEETGGISVGWMCVWMLVCGLGVWALAE